MSVNNREGTFIQDDSYEVSTQYRLKKVLNLARVFYPLYIALFVGLLFLSALLDIVVDPIYTATAVVGPPNPSPTDTLLAGISGGAAGAARKLLGGSLGGVGGGNDPFQEYLQLLTSERLSNELSEKDNILPIVFFDKWDTARGQWKSPGLLHMIAAPIKRLLQKPVSEHPNAADLHKYFEQHLRITPSISYAASVLSTSSYMDVSLKFPDRDKAQTILNAALRRADEIVREEQMRDVKSRIAYIDAELPKVTQAEQREGLIETLSNQEELLTMLVADHRYSSTLVEPAFAPPEPTFPPTLLKSLVFSSIGAAVLWGVLLWFGQKSEWLGRMFRRFRRSGGVA